MIGEYFQGQTKWVLLAPDHKADLIFYRKGGIEGTFTGPHDAWNLEGVSHTTSPLFNRLCSLRQSWTRSG